MLEVGAIFAGFGGFYVDGSNIQIYYKGDAPNARLLHQAIVTAFSDPVLADLQPSIQEAEYSFAQLKTWQRALNASEIPGIQTKGVDDFSNRLKIRVLSVATAQPAVDRMTRALDIPRQAVVLEEVPPFIDESSLRYHSHRPIVGGLEISGPSSCSIGFHCRPPRHTWIRYG